MYLSNKKRSNESAVGSSSHGIFSKKQKIISDYKINITVAPSHTFLQVNDIKGEVKLYSCGDNQYGQLGLGHRNSVEDWTEVSIPKDFQLEKIAVGFRHTFIIGKGSKGEIKLYSCGSNGYGELGLGLREKVKGWTEVTMPKDFQLEKMAAGNLHRFMIGKASEGEVKVFSCGGNGSGQLGLGHREKVKGWTEVDIPKDFQLEKIETGYGHSFMSGKGNECEVKVFSCGKNSDGQLGLGHSKDVKGWVEVDLPKGFQLEKIELGGFHTFIIGKGSEGKMKIYAVGYNEYGQLGLGHTNRVQSWTEVIMPKDFQLEKIEAGYRHSFMIGKGNEGEVKVFSCGDNSYGKSGLGYTRSVDDWTEVPIDKLLEGFKKNNDGFSKISDQSEKISERQMFQGFRAEDYGC